MQALSSCPPRLESLGLDLPGAKELVILRSGVRRLQRLSSSTKTVSIWGTNGYFKEMLSFYADDFLRYLVCFDWADFWSMSMLRDINFLSGVEMTFAGAVLTSSACLSMDCILDFILTGLSAGSFT